MLRLRDSITYVQRLLGSHILMGTSTTMIGVGYSRDKAVSPVAGRYTIDNGV